MKLIFIICLFMMSCQDKQYKYLPTDSYAVRFNKETGDYEKYDNGSWESLFDQVKEVKTNVIPSDLYLEVKTFGEYKNYNFTGSEPKIVYFVEDTTIMFYEKVLLNQQFTIVPKSEEEVPKLMIKNYSNYDITDFVYQCDVIDKYSNDVIISYHYGINGWLDFYKNQPYYAKGYKYSFSVGSYQFESTHYGTTRSGYKNNDYRIDKDWQTKDCYFLEMRGKIDEKWNY